MPDYTELKPDAETFARVWKRVMPDESLSQIVVHPPEASPPAPPTILSTTGQEEPGMRLRAVMEALDEGMAGAEAILHWKPGAWPMGDELRKSAAQLRAAWLLMTGQKWNRVIRRTAGHRETARLLREQYRWELRFAQLCREAEAAIRVEDIREIFPEQAVSSQRRRKMLRYLLAET